MDLEPRSRRSARVAAALAVSALLLASCGTLITQVNPSASSSATEPGMAATSAPASPEPLSSPEQGMAPAQPETTPLGGTYTWADGLAVSVSEPSPYRPSDTAAYDKAPAYVSFTVRIENQTGDSYDPGMFLTSVQSGTSEGSQIFDTAKGLNGAPSTKVLPGRSVEFVIGYSIEDPNDIVMEVTPSFDAESAIFTS